MKITILVFWSLVSKSTELHHSSTHTNEDISEYFSARIFVVTDNDNVVMDNDNQFSLLQFYLCELHSKLHHSSTHTLRNIESFFLDIIFDR